MTFRRIYLYVHIHPNDFLFHLEYIMIVGKANNFKVVMMHSISLYRFIIRVSLGIIRLISSKNLFSLVITDNMKTKCR
jgi:hypothetical protein